MEPLFSEKQAREILQENKLEAQRISRAYKVAPNNLQNFLKGLASSGPTIGFFLFVAERVSKKTEEKEPSAATLTAARNITAEDLLRAADAVEMSGNGKGVPLAKVIGFLVRITSEVYGWTILLTGDWMWLPNQVWHG